MPAPSAWDYELYFAIGKRGDYVAGWSACLFVDLRNSLSKGPYFFELMNSKSLQRRYEPAQNHDEYDSSDYRSVANPIGGLIPVLLGTIRSGRSSSSQR
jgi:hypothetical protein